MYAGAASEAPGAPSMDTGTPNYDSHNHFPALPAAKERRAPVVSLSPAGVTPPAMPAVDDTSFAAAKNRVETALGFVKSLSRAQVDGAEGKVIAWTGGGTTRKAGLPRPGQLALGRLEVLRCTSVGSGRSVSCCSARVRP